MIVSRIPTSERAAERRSLAAYERADSSMNITAHETRARILNKAKTLLARRGALLRKHVDLMTWIVNLLGHGVRGAGRSGSLDIRPKARRTVETVWLESGVKSLRMEAALAAKILARPQEKSLDVASTKGKDESMLTSITAKSLGDFKDRINSIAEAMQIRFVLVSEEAVSTGEVDAAAHFNSEEPAVIAAKFPEGSGARALIAFRRELGEVIGRMPQVVSFNSLPREILEFRVKL